MGAGGRAAPGRGPAAAAAAVGLVLVVVALLTPDDVRGWVVLGALLPAGPLVALAVRRFEPERGGQWLLVAAGGVALSVAWLGVLLGSGATTAAGMVALYGCLGASAHLALGPAGGWSRREGGHRRAGRSGGHRWVLAVDVAAVAVVGLAAAAWLRGAMTTPPPPWAQVLLAGDLVLLAYLVALLHARARVTPSVLALSGALTALVGHHALVWLAGARTEAGAAALVVVAALAVVAAWHPSMAAFGDVVSPLVAPRRQALVVVPAVLALPAAGALAALGLLPVPAAGTAPVVAGAVLLSVVLMTVSFAVSSAVDRGLLETDPLTRTGSRLALERLLATQIHSGAAPVHLVVVELDEVAALATRQGRQAADDLLRRRSATLVRGLPDAVVCRTGPQTLAVVAPAAPRGGRSQTPLELVAAVRAQLSRPVGSPAAASPSGVPPATAAVLTVPPRAGVAQHGIATRRIVDALLQHAELSLLAARDRGVPVEADVTRDGAYERARRLDHDLAAALTGAGQIAVHYQPLVDPRTGAVRSLEALVRWEHPELGSVAPDDFLAAASLQGRARDLDDLARRRALADFARWSAAGVQPEHVAVNLSAASLESPDLVERVVADLRASGVEPGALVLEVVEQERLRDLRTVADRLASLHALGVGVAVDDFGVGHAALHYLLHLPVTTIKLDRSLVAEVLTPDGRALLGSAVALATSLGATAVAEGVESADQMRAVAELGFTLAQGFHCGRPRPVGDTELLLADERRRAATGPVRPAATPAAAARGVRQEPSGQRS
ncbi:EAL domain-containing protein [Pseudokineococcus basanitobsidens]|uniref:EAL domain-containing protein n=1 Tax=Pseudokineococcus basanitobsidens TaxID=1926649 RepID=A0ABU8RNU0_9ACTN